MMRFLILLLIGSVGLLSSCKTDDANSIIDKEIQSDDKERGGDTILNNNLLPNDTKSDNIGKEAESTLFSNTGFDDKIYYELLIETHLCNPNYDPSLNDGTVPCSAKFFQFFSYNNKRRIEDAFLLQVKAGVNNFPYRRLLIFVREKGELVLMNGIIGYLVERIPSSSGIDDLVVAVIDDLGNSVFDRYDVLLHYKDGKYEFVEALGDLYGEFNTKDLKDRASVEIKKRIAEKRLIF